MTVSSVPPPGLHRLHADDVVVLAQGDAADAVGRAAHRPDVVFVEADGHAVPRADEDFAGAVGQLHGDDRVVVLDAHRDDAAGARVLKADSAVFFTTPGACPS